jgi:hypothetical protein
MSCSGSAAKENAEHHTATSNAIFFTTTKEATDGRKI